jgi:hypothetical protein
MIAMSIFLVLRPHHGDKGVRSPYAGLIGIHCIDPPDNDLIPVEQIHALIVAAVLPLESGRLRANVC